MLSEGVVESQTTEPETMYPYCWFTAEEQDLKLHTTQASARRQLWGEGIRLNPCSGILIFSVVSVMLESFLLKVTLPTQSASKNKDFMLLSKKNKCSSGLGRPQGRRVRVEGKVKPGKAHDSQKPREQPPVTRCAQGRRDKS